MLIRSQDKKTLTKFEKIYIISSLNGFLKKENLERDLIAAVGNCTSIIGTYSTEEKAMKVLDDIVDAYVSTLYTDNKAVIATRLVYEMPQDEEIEDG